MSWKLGGASFLVLLMTGCGSCASEPESAPAPATATEAPAAASDEAREAEAAEPAADEAAPSEEEAAAAGTEADLGSATAEGLVARTTDEEGAGARRLGGLDRRAEPEPAPEPEPEPEPEPAAAPRPAPAPMAAAPAPAQAEEAEDAPPAEPEVRTARVRVDRSGGVVRLDGATVTFPPDAVRLPRTVTLSHAQDQWQLAVEGLEAFHRPVAVALPATGAAKPVWAPVAGQPSTRRAAADGDRVRFDVYRPGRGTLAAGPTDTVTVVTRNAHVLERGRMQVTVVDPLPFEAFVRDGDGLRALPVTQAPGSGVVEIADVPAERAVLLGRRGDRSGLWVESTAGAVDWSRMVEAEARGQIDPAAPGTALDLALNSAEDWSPSHGVVFAARNGLYATGDAPSETAGTLDWTISWDEQPLPMAPLSASKGDVAEVAQTRRRSLDDGSSYTVPVRWARLTDLEMANGGTTRRDVALQPVTGSQMADVRVDAGALYRLRGRLGPGAPRFTSGPSVTVKTVLDDHTGATLLTAQGFDPEGVVDLSRYAMPRPYEAASDLVVSAFLMDVYDAAPYGHGSGYAVVEAPYSQAKGGRLAPTLSGPSGLTVNGRSALSGPVKGVGDAPRLAWAAPETGDPDYYRVALKLSGARPRIYTFFTRDTGLRLPALGLAPGDVGVIEVTAVDEAGARPAPGPRPAAPVRPTTTVTLVSSGVTF